MRLTSILLLICGLAQAAMASGTSHWTATSETDFNKGKFHNVVATNLGDLKLSRAVRKLLEQDPRISSVYALAEGPDRTIYAGTGPHGIVLQLKGEKISTLLTLEDENIFSLLVDNYGSLLIGTGGEKGRILKLTKAGEKPVELFSADGVQYIWQMRQTKDGAIYVATGPNGQVFEIAPDGRKSVLLDSDENNILSLLSDGGEMLYAGTDPNGLVYRINRKTKEAFVLYDAPEGEVSALVLDARGNLYAGTSQAPDQDEGRSSPRTSPDKTGRPESAQPGRPLPSPKPQTPTPPQSPQPDPSEPNPIPRTRDQFLFLDESLERMIAAGDFDQTEEMAEAPAPGPVPPPEPAPAPAPNQTVRRVAPLDTPQRVPSGTGQAFSGNAIYRIDPAGFVTEVFRQPAMVLSMLEKDGVLLVGTGSEGLVYQVNPALEETVVLAKVDPKQVMSMLAAKDGRVILGMANVGGIASMSSGFAPSGAYTSPVLDAAQISRFGKIHLRGSLPVGTGLSIATRSGNLRDPGERGWSAWSEEIPVMEYVQVPSPSARFLQYRLTFSSAEPNATAVVDEVDVAYALPNLAPQVKSIRIIPAEAQPAGNAPRAAERMRRIVSGRVRALAWEAVDPDSDPMEYTLYFRSGTQGPWIMLQEKLHESQFLWDTRGVSDGNYQVKVVASDVKSNPRGEGLSGTRVSETIVVDNTPPVIGDVKVSTERRSVRIDAKVVDRGSAVAAVEYSVDSKDDWQAAAAADKIFDSPDEGASMMIEKLAPGAHQIMLRATDEYGNQAYETVQVTAPENPS